METGKIGITVEPRMVRHQTSFGSRPNCVFLEPRVHEMPADVSTIIVPLTSDQTESPTWSMNFLRTKYGGMVAADASRCPPSSESHWHQSYLEPRVHEMSTGVSIIRVHLVAVLLRTKMAADVPLASDQTESP